MKAPQHWEGDAGHEGPQRRSPIKGRGRLTRLLVGLLVRPEHRAEAGEHEGAQPPGPLLVAAVVVQGVGRQHKPVLPRPYPGGLHTAPHLPLQPTWEGEASAPATSTIRPTGSPAQGRVCLAPAQPVHPVPLGQDPATVRARSCQPWLYPSYSRGRGPRAPAWLCPPFTRASGSSSTGPGPFSTMRLRISSATSRDLGMTRG